MLTFRLSSSLILMLILAGCAKDVVIDKPSFNIPNQYKEFGDWVEISTSSQSLPDDWWTGFNDDILNKLEAKIDESNPTLAIYWSRLEQSRAITATVSAQTLPNINAFGQMYSNRQSDHRPLRGSNQPDEFGANTLGLSIDYDLDLWGKVSDEVKSGKALERASESDYANAKIGLRTELAYDYLELRRIDALINLYKSTIETYEKQLRLTTNLHNEGVVSGLDVSRSKAQLERAKEQHFSAKIERAKVEHTIAILIGELPSNFSIDNLDIRNLALPEVSIALPSTLLERRPDVSGAINKLVSANQEIGVATKAYFPNVTLGLTAGFQNGGSLGLLSAPNLFWALGPSAVLNIFDGGRRDAGVKLATAQRDQIAAEYRLVVLKAFQQVEDNLVTSNILERRVESANHVVNDNQNLYKHVMNRYFEGIDSYFEVTIVNQELLKANESFINLRFKQFETRLALIHSLGGGWIPQPPHNHVQ